MDNFFDEIKENFCGDCLEKEKCQIVCPAIFREIVGIDENQMI